MDMESHAPFFWKYKSLGKGKNRYPQRGDVCTFIYEKLPAMLTGTGQRGRGWDNMEMPEPGGSSGRSCQLEAHRIDPAKDTCCLFKHV